MPLKKRQKDKTHMHAQTLTSTHTHTHRFNQQTAFHQLPIKTSMPLQRKGHAFSPTFYASLRIGSCLIGGGVYYYIWCHMSQEEIDRRVRQPCCHAVAFLSCCNCCLFSSHLYIYLTSAGNPLRLKV